MTIKSNIDGKTCILAVEGRLDTTTAPELDTYAAENLNDIDDLTLDFENLEYISSAGLRVLLKMQKVIGRRGTMKVVHVNDMINEVFSITGFDSILTIE